jgi:ribonuclease R
MDRRGRREGTIVEVLERRLTRLIGRYTLEAGIGYVVPDDKRVQRNVMIPRRRATTRATANWWSPKSPPRRIAPPADRQRAGGAGRQAHAVAGGRSRDPRPRHPARIPARSAGEATAVPLQVQLPTSPGASTCATCRWSPSTARTPRISTTRCGAKPNKDGFRLIVAIADVSHYVRPARRWTTKRRLRATSVYFPGFVVPMLPETLSATASVR